MIRELYYLFKLRRNLYKNENSVKSLQLKKLRSILIHAYENTRYYHDLFEKIGFDPYSIKNAKEIEKIPILTKKEMQDNYDNIFAKNYDKNKAIVHLTSGSSGIPLKIYNDKVSEAYNIALRYRSYFENGLSVRDRILDITSPDYLNIDETFFQKLGFFKKYRISIFEEENKMIEQIEKIKPDIIQAYPSVLYLIAKTLKRKLSFKPKAIFTSSEVLTKSMKKTIEKKFNCPVKDFYGCEEFNRLAWECEKGEGYHLDIDEHVIEFVDDRNKIVDKGEGYFVVTSLFNRAFPFIRYKIGDIARLTDKRCSCKRTFPVIEGVQGRDDDYLVLPSGRVISPRRINIIEEIPGIKHYQTTQVEKDHFVVDFIKDHNYSSKTIPEIKKQIKKGCYGEEITVKVNVVNEIKKGRTGKIRAVVSKVKK